MIYVTKKWTKYIYDIQQQTTTSPGIYDEFIYRLLTWDRHIQNIAGLVILAGTQLSHKIGQWCNTITYEQTIKINWKDWTHQIDTKQKNKLQKLKPDKAEHLYILVTKKTSSTYLRILALTDSYLKGNNISNQTKCIYVFDVSIT